MLEYVCRSSEHGLVYEQDEQVVQVDDKQRDAHTLGLHLSWKTSVKDGRPASVRMRWSPLQTPMMPKTCYVMCELEDERAEAEVWGCFHRGFRENVFVVFKESKKKQKYFLKALKQITGKC